MKCMAFLLVALLGSSCSFIIHGPKTGTAFKAEFHRWGGSVGFELPFSPRYDAFHRDQDILLHSAMDYERNAREANTKPSEEEEE